MDLNVQNFLGFNSLQTALEEGNQLIKEITRIKLKYAHKRRLVINFLNSLMITMNRREINWGLNHKFYFTQCLEIFSRAALQLGVGTDFIQYIDELWVPIQKDNFKFTIKTPPWAIELYVNRILSIIANVENNKKRDKLFIQIGSPILNVLLLQPSFEVQILMWNALTAVLNKVSNVRNTFISLLRNFPNHEKAMRGLIETYLQTVTFTPVQSRQFIRALNLNCTTLKIYTLICTSVAINNIFISAYDDEFHTYANFALAHKSISLQIKRNDLDLIFGEPLYMHDNMDEVLYIYFDCIQTISYYPNKTNASFTCIEIKFTNCFPLSYNENTSLKKMCCTVAMTEEQLATFLKMLENFQINDKLSIHNGPEKIFTGIGVTTTADNVSPDIINPSTGSDDNPFTTIRNINIFESKNMTTRTYKGTFFNKALDNYNVSPSSTDNASAKMRKLVTATPTEDSPGVCAKSANRTSAKRRRLNKHLCIALSEQPEPVSFALNMSPSPQVVSNILLDEVVPETVRNSADERIIGNKNLEDSSRPQDNSVMLNDSFSLRTNSDLEKQIESPVENRSSVNYIVSTTSNDSLHSSNLEKKSRCSQQLKSPVNEHLSLQHSISFSRRNINSNLEKQSPSVGLLRSLLSQRIESTVNNKHLASSNDASSQGLTESSEKNSMCSQQYETRIAQIRTQDSISSNSVDERAVNATTPSPKSFHVDANLFTKKIFVLISNPNKSAINAKTQSMESSQVNDQLADQNTYSAVANPEEIQAPLPVASSQELNNVRADPEWQCGKHFSMLTPSSSSNTESSTENVTDGYTQYMQTLFAELNKFTETTTMNQQINAELHNKMMYSLFNALISYNKFWCNENQEFKEQFQQHQDVFKDLRSKL